MSTAARIRTLRIRAGKSRTEIAQSLGLNTAWYDDLENNEGELAATLTLFQAMQLASLLGVKLHALFDVPAPEPIPLGELPERLRAHAARTGSSIEALEREIGWDLSEILASPVQAAAEEPIDLLMAIAAPLGIDWLSLVPEDDPD